MTNMWPSEARPAYGTFVESQMRSVAEAGVSVRVHFVDRVGKRLAYGRSALRMLMLNIEPRRVDLIHAHTGHCGVLARLQLRYPVLVSYVGYDLYGKHQPSGEVTLKSRLEALLFRALALTFDATITKSRALEAALPGSARARNTVLPNGVDRRLFRPLSRELARQRLGWPAHELAVLFVGDPNVPRKRFALAEEVCAGAQDSLADVTLRVCSGVQTREVPLWMNGADVLLLTSMAEGSPNVIKEAMACNLPIVAVDVGDVAEVVRGTRRCRVTGHSREALIVALLEVLRGAPARSDGRERTGHLALEAIATRLVRIYRRVAGTNALAEGAVPTPAPTSQEPLATEVDA